MRIGDVSIGRRNEQDDQLINPKKNHPSDISLDLPQPKLTSPQPLSQPKPKILQPHPRCRLLPPLPSLPRPLLRPLRSTTPDSQSIEDEIKDEVELWGVG